MPEHDSKTWKAYDQNPVTHSAAHYLLTIQSLIDEHGYARTTDIARELDITAGSCSQALRSLKQKGFLVEDNNKFFRLSPEGEKMVTTLRTNSRVLATFFTDVLGLPTKRAEVDACKIEHLVHQSTVSQMRKLTEFIKAHPECIEQFQEGKKGA